MSKNSRSFRQPYRKRVSIKNFLAMKLTTRMLYYYQYGSCCVVNFTARKSLDSFPISPPPLQEGGTLCRIATEILTVEGLGSRGLGFGCTLAQPPAHFGCVAPVISAARRGTDTQTHQMRHFGKRGPCAHRFHAPRINFEDRVGPTERVYRVVLHKSIPAQIRALILYYYGYKE